MKSHNLLGIILIGAALTAMAGCGGSDLPSADIISAQNICQSDADCPSGDVCQKSECVQAPVAPPPACQTDADCTSGDVCNSGVCEAAPVPPKDTTAPTLMPVTPGDGAKFTANFQGLRKVTFSLSFSEAMDPSSMSGIHFVHYLSNGTQETIAATVTPDTGNDYKVSAVLKIGTYTLEIPGSPASDPLTDLAGNALDTDNEISFKILAFPLLVPNPNTAI